MALRMELARSPSRILFSTPPLNQAHTANGHQHLTPNLRSYRLSLRPKPRPQSCHPPLSHFLTGIHLCPDGIAAFPEISVCNGSTVMYQHLALGESCAICHGVPILRDFGLSIHAQLLAERGTEPVVEVHRYADRWGFADILCDCALQI